MRLIFQKFPKTKSRGVTLLLVVVVLSAILSISIGIFHLVFGQIMISGEEGDSLRSFFAADQGSEAILFRDRIFHQPLCPVNSTCDPVIGFDNVDVGGGGCYKITMIQSDDANGDGAVDTTTLISRGEYRCGAGAKRQVFRTVELAFGGSSSPPQGGFSPDTDGALESGLVAYWPLEETSGTRSDVRRSNHLTDNNTVTSNPGIRGNAGQFTRANTEFLSIGDTTDLSMGGPEISFTIAAWVYPDSINGQGIITKATSGAGTSAEYALWFTGSGAQIDLYVADDVTLTTVRSSPLTIGSWNFVTAWHDAALNQIAISINNGAAATAPHTVGSYDSSGGLEIGSWRPTTGWVWDGRIDEVGIWKRVLTVQERTDLYNGGNGNTCHTPCQP